MEEEMMVLIRRRNPYNYSTWKLYNNPFYYPHSQQQQHCHHHHHHNPSARKLAASLWDLTFVRSVMESELDMARAKIHELKAELEQERRARKKVEMINRKLCKQILEERKRREAIEDVCEKLAKEIATEKVVADRMKKDMVEERKMLRMAEMLREERVQMKLTDAKILFEEKLSELESTTKVAAESKLEVSKSETASASLSENFTSSSINNNNVGASSNPMNKSRTSPEAENPHIKRGIKGFVEFPRVVRAISSRGRQLGSKVECQKAQLRLLLRQKSPFRANNLIMG